MGKNDKSKNPFFVNISKNKKRYYNFEIAMYYLGL